MFGLDIPDLLTLSAYLLGITLLGMWMVKTVHNTTDFFVGGRRFGKAFSTLHAFGTGTHSDQAVIVAAKTYTAGMSGIWYQWLWLFCTPFYWWIAPIFRRARAITTGDYFELRYSRSVAMLFVFVAILQLMVNIGVMLKGSGAVIRATTGGEVGERAAIISMTVMFVAYGVTGGFSAAVVTDFVQGLMTIVFSFLLLPLAIYHLGGFAGLHAGVAENVPDAQEIWSLAQSGEITWFYIIVIALNGLIGIVTQPHSMPQYNAARTDREAQIGGVVGNMIKRFCTVAWTLLGMCAIVMFPGMVEKEDIDQSFGKIAHQLLPQIMPGLIGVFVASLLASVMSSCDSFMITCSALFTHNVYRPLIAPNKSEHHYINVGRAAAVVTVAGGVLVAYELDSVVKGLELFWKISAIMGLAFWLGLFWRRPTAAGAWAGTLTSFAVFLATSKISLLGYTLWDFNAHFASRLPAFMLFEEKLYLPWQMILYLTAGLVTLIAVSLVTRRTRAADLDRFYAVLRTPVQPGEVIERPLTLPPDVEPAPQRKLINHRDWEIQRPTRRGIIGFLATWAVVLALIGGVVVLVRIGA